MIKKIILGLLIIIISILAFSYYWNQTLLTRLEEKYNKTHNYSNLIDLCRNLYGSNNYDKLIKYYPKMLNEKDTFIKNVETSEDVETEYSIYTFWYLKALLHSKQYDKYKTEFNNYFDKLNSLAIIEKLYNNYIKNDSFNNQELNTILESAQDNVKKINGIKTPSKDQINRYKTLQNIIYNIYSKTNNEDEASKVLEEKNIYLKNAKQNN